MPNLNLSLLPSLKDRRRKKRVGRGQGSGKGSHTTGRGSKGQKIRGKVRLYFEGGQLPITKRLPHQGGFRRPTVAVNLLKLSHFNAFENGSTITPDFLKEKGLVWGTLRRIKVVAGGSLKKKLAFRGLKFSASAYQQVLAAGGTVTD